MNENYIDICELPIYDSDLPRRAMSFCQIEGIKARLLLPTCFNDKCILQVAETENEKTIEELQKLFG